MFKIGEFSKITQVSVRMLRYYEEQNLLLPSQIDESSGYRFYEASQMELLNRIVMLRDLGFGVAKIREMLNSWDEDCIRENLIEQQKRTLDNIEAEKRRYQHLQGMLQDITGGGSKPAITITIKSLPMQQVISMRRILPDYYAEASLWEEMTKKMRSLKDAERLQSFSIYHDKDYREKDVDVEICVVSDNPLICRDTNGIIHRQVVPVEEAACFMVYGPYSKISNAYREFGFWLEKHPEYQMQGENRQICHVSECQTSQLEEYVTELQIPLIHRPLEGTEL